MKRRVKIYEYECDKCHKTTRTESLALMENYPKGWERRAIHGCGMTDYSTKIDVCPNCARDPEREP